MEKHFETQSFDPETENSHSRASGIGKTCSGFDLITSREKMVNSCKTKARGGKSCVSETSNSHLSTVTVWTVQLAGNSSIPVASLGRKQGLLRAAVISSAVTL